LHDPGSDYKKIRIIEVLRAVLTAEGSMLITLLARHRPAEEGEAHTARYTGP